MAFLFLGSAVFGAYHAGVEWGFWPGPAGCTGSAAQKAADEAKRSAKLAKINYKSAKAKYRDAKQAAKKLRKAVRALKDELAQIGRAHV